MGGGTEPGRKTMTERARSRASLFCDEICSTLNVFSTIARDWSCVSSLMKQPLPVLTTQYLQLCFRCSSSTVSVARYCLRLFLYVSDPFYSVHGFNGAYKFSSYWIDSSYWSHQRRKKNGGSYYSYLTLNTYYGSFHEAGQG